MATDYNEIGKTPRINYRNIFTPYSDKTHFIYELVQNADDNKSQCIELQLYEDGLLVWNDGNQFSEKDVRSICSIGFSNKDLTQIGSFGMGFKAVYAYTDNPEVYSGDERFRIRISNPTKPEGINKNEIDEKVLEQLDAGRTVFWLPFRENMRPEIEIEHLKNRLCNLEIHTLLFLHNISMVQWYDKNNRQRGTYSCQRQPHHKIQNVSEVQLRASIDGNDQPLENLLVFRKEVQPPEEVINELQLLSEDNDERHRIQRSADKLQPVEIAFYLKDGEIKEMESCVLFAYLPTEIKTGLRFILQARYQTTLARDNIERINGNPWNRWLVQETADFLPDVLEKLKDEGILKASFFNVFPLKDDPVRETFTPVVDGLQKAMREKAFVPTEKEGNYDYAKAENVLYPHDKLLRQLFDSNWLFPNSSWLHPKIQDKEEYRRRFAVMQEAGVKTVKITRILSWLEKQDVEWFEGRCNEWLLTLYTYLNKYQSRLERIKKLPLVRLENGQHVSASDGLVFLPPDTDEEREEIAPFLKELPILMSVLLEGDSSYEIETFLKRLGVRALHPEDIISESICPKYLQSEKPSIAQNRLHVHYLFKIWDKISETEIKKKICETPILCAYKGFQKENSDFVVPYDAYLSQTYTGNTDLENYFSVSNGEIWFVDGGYLNDESKRKDWFKFLKVIGTMDTSQRIKENLSFSSENSQEFNKRGLKWERSNYKQTIEDYYLEGLSDVLAEITDYQNVDLSRSLWFLLVKTVSVEKRQQVNFFNGTHNWFHYSDNSKTFDATFYRQLKETTWLPDEQGNLHRPSECFALTSENKKVLGNSVAYLHPDFDISQDNETAQWLAGKLGVHLNADTDSVMNYLQILSDPTVSDSTVNVEDIEPLYRFLDRQDARRQEEFETKHLIFTPKPESSWWHADKVFWEDESVVFGNDRGYLKKYYPENLRSFFNVSGVSERAAPLDYVRGIQDVTSTGNPGDEKVRKRVRILYGRLWQYLLENDISLDDEEWQEEWEETREGKCWLGKKGNEWGFFYWDELVWKDDDNRSRLFKDEIPFWAFDNDMLELAKHINVKGCYQNSEVEFAYYGDRGENLIWSEKVQNLHPYIYDFLNSPRLCEEHLGEKTAEVLCRLTVCIAEKFEVRYKLKGISVTDPKPRQSFLDITDQEVKLWLAIEANENDYDWLIGDALQDYFGDVKELGAFVEDLLTKPEKVLTRWKLKGLQVDLCVSSPEPDPKASEEPPKSVDEKPQIETGSGHDAPEKVESEGKTPIVHEGPETGSGSTNSVTEGSETRTDTPPSTSGTSQSGGHWRSTSSGGNGGGGHGSHSGGGESNEHRELKENLASNPSQLGKGLELVKIEYTFDSNDRVDILLRDGFGNPVTVEVETGFSFGNGRHVGVWQAVKYKHLAAVKYGLPCEHVRSILAAPEIPDDVKAKCKELGIEPIEVSHI